MIAPRDDSPLPLWAGHGDRLKLRAELPFFGLMKVLCECGMTAEELLSRLRLAGWVQPRGPRIHWICPECVVRRESTPTQEILIEALDSSRGG
jgi:hypothetical protein